MGWEFDDAREAAAAMTPQQAATADREIAEFEADQRREWREPYVGQGADGARRSAQIDREEADVMAPGSRLHGLLLASAERWDRQAEQMEEIFERPEEHE